MIDVLSSLALAPRQVIDLSSATEDYALGFGEVAKITYTTSDSTKPLRVKTVQGVYEITMIGDLGGDGKDSVVTLRANNALTAAGDWDYVMYAAQVATSDSSASTTVGGWKSGVSATAAYLAERNIISATSIVSTVTTAKTVRTEVLGKSTTPSYGISIYACFWQDTTTAWTSLGTIGFVGIQAGTAYVRRLF